jgi:hypothetical protein
MDDPLSRALSAAGPVEPDAPYRSQPIAETIERLRSQIHTVLNEHFFDAGVEDEPVPLVHHTLIDSGSIRMTARRAEPAYEAEVTVDIRTLGPAADATQHDQIEARGILRRRRASHPSEHAFAIGIVPAADGTRSIDEPAFIADLTAAIRRFAAEDDRA